MDIWKDEEIARYFVQQLKDEDEIGYVERIIRKSGNKGNFILVQLLNSKFPKFNWISLSSKEKKSQYMLKESLDQLFPKEEGIFLLFCLLKTNLSVGRV